MVQHFIKFHAQGPPLGMKLDKMSHHCQDTGNHFLLDFSVFFIFNLPKVQRGPKANLSVTGNTDFQRQGAVALAEIGILKRFSVPGCSDSGADPATNAMLACTV